MAGVETRTDPTDYRRDGMKRGGDPAYPFVVVQCTLEGWGAYETGNDMTRVKPGEAFFAVVPTDHAYYLPRESSSWTFFYLIIRHPYVVSRLTRSVQTVGAVHHMQENGALLPRLTHLFESVYTRSFRDEFEEEEALLEFAVEVDRYAHYLVYPRSPREELMTQVRAHVLRNLTSVVEVSDIAVDYGMTRSHFSHHFKAITGIAPATFVRQVRLQEVVRLLLKTDLKLDAIAASTGFASATDLCKVFRRHYNSTPALYRKQMQS
jgi:AraC-like DNA-binding protein